MPQLNSPVLGTSQVRSQPSRTKPLVKTPAPVPSDPGAASLPFTQCPSAMKCVEKKLCDFNGVMRDFVTTLSPAQESLRVPLIPCVSQQAGSEVDVCCRDPNYKVMILICPLWHIVGKLPKCDTRDPWP